MKMSLFLWQTQVSATRKEMCGNSTVECYDQLPNKVKWGQTLEL